MRGVYVAYCNENGTLKDDSILYKYAEDDYLLMPSDIDHDAYFESLRCRLGLDDLSVVECTSSLIGMAIQGPMSASLLHRWGLDAIENLEPFEVREYPLGGGAMRVSRMGFTADLGYECWLEPDLSEAFQQGIVEAGESLSLEVPGYGLTALEACRLEGGLIVPGWDCSTEADPNPDLERTPFELGVGWLVDFDDRNFVGREALLEYKRTGHRFLRRSFIAETHREPEPGAEIHSTVDGGDSVIGAITCARWSWGFERVVGSASIERPSAGLTEAWVQVEDERVPLQLARGALVDLERRSQTPAPIHD
jgi:aminomethyltransferase